MANGGSPLPSPHTASSSMSLLPRSSAAIGQTPSSTLLQPHEHHLSNRASFETLTSVASSNPNSSSSSAQLRRPARDSSSSNSSAEHYPAARAARPQFRQVRWQQQQQQQHHVHRSSNSSLPPVRALPPALHAPHAEVHWRGSPFEADQFVEGSADDNDEETMMIPAGLDLSLGSLYGFPYCMGVPDAMEQRARALAEAEEAEYQREKEWKAKARLSGRVSSALKNVSLQGTLPWTRRGRR
jgi:hypothetical protein